VRNPAADLVAQRIAFEYRIAPCDLDQAAFGGHGFPVTTERCAVKSVFKSMGYTSQIRKSFRTDSMQ
jgi:hypothetical protein